MEYYVIFKCGPKYFGYLVWGVITPYQDNQFFVVFTMSSCLWYGCFCKLLITDCVVCLYSLCCCNPGNQCY